MTKKTAAKKPAKQEPAKVLSDEEIVLEKYPDAECEDFEKGFLICASDKEPLIPLHSGIAKSESDAWKLAAHQVL